MPRKPKLTALDLGPDDRLEPELLGRLQAELEKRRESYRAAGARYGAVGEGEIDEATRAQLEALGYVSKEK